MSPDVIERLLALNRAFFATAAHAFDATRRGVPAGMVRVLAQALSHNPPCSPLRVLDAGCGNGRLLRALAHALPAGAAVDYWGVDSDAALLAIAAAACAQWADGRARVAQGDLLLPHLGLNTAAVPANHFDLVACLAVLHHIPGAARRAQALRNLAAMLAPRALLLLSTWQFTHSTRLRARVAPWAAIGLTPDDVDPGDALLPWDQGAHALRYVHSVDETEIHALAAAAGLAVESTLLADGHEGNLNLYAVLRRNAIANCSEQKEQN